MFNKINKKRIEELEDENNKLHNKLFEYQLQEMTDSADTKYWRSEAIRLTKKLDELRNGDPFNQLLNVLSKAKHQFIIYENNLFYDVAKTNYEKLDNCGWSIYETNDKPNGIILVRKN